MGRSKSRQQMNVIVSPADLDADTARGPRATPDVVVDARAKFTMERPLSVFRAEDDVVAEARVCRRHASSDYEVPSVLRRPPFFSRA